MPTVIDPKLIKSFKTQKQFRSWMIKNSTISNGIWLKLFRKNSGIKSINNQEALDVALCFGLIDGQVKKLDDINSWVQRFTPRRRESIWSQRNVENVKRLIEGGFMTPAGQEQIDEAKKDGRWKMAYGSGVNFQMPKDFLEELSKHKKAENYFLKLNRSKKYSIYWKLQTLKTETTREKWKNTFVQMLSEEKF
jgi:uncharacterized protein YdeI (YjbR/CyaY-like superfamily)